MVIFPEAMQVESQISVIDSEVLLQEYGCAPEDLILTGSVPKIDND